jgi:Leucine-rich repeat (LRR) protein
MRELGIEGIYDFALGTYDHLVELHLLSNCIKGCLPLIKAPKLSKLSLNENSISSLDCSFRLKELMSWINSFLFRMKPFSHGSYDNLISLDLSNNPLVTFPPIKVPKLK